MTRMRILLCPAWPMEFSILIAWRPRLWSAATRIESGLISGILAEALFDSNKGAQHLHGWNLVRVDRQQVRIQYGDVGQKACRDLAGAVFRETGKGVVPGVANECLFGGHFLVRQPTVGVGSVKGAASDCTVQPG